MSQPKAADTPDNTTDLLPAAARALERVKEALDKTGFVFSGLPDITIEHADHLRTKQVLCVRVVFAVPLQRDSGGTPTNPDSSDLSSSPTNFS